MRVSVTFAMAATVAATAEAGNPIRRVVSMLQSMQKKVEQEGEEAEELFAKFECYCTKNSESLSKSIADGEQKTSDLQTAQGANSAEKKQIEEELKQHKDERAAANDAVEQATSMRKKENNAFEQESADLNSNLKAMNAALDAITKGVSGAFLQSDEGSVFRHVVDAASDEYKSDLKAFLQSAQTGAGSDEIVGILKTMVEEMTARLGEITTNENEAVQNFNALISAKNAEIAAAQEAIESKTARVGELAVKIATDANDLKATQKSVAADEEYLEGLKKNCKDSTAEYEATRKDRAEELLAIADTIKLLNSDDALELFKKSLPSPSLLQVQDSSRSLRQEAMKVLRGKHGVNVGLILSALHGKARGLGGMDKMLDGMVSSLKEEQADDDSKLAYCKKELEKVADHVKDVDFRLGDVQAQIEAQEEAIETYTSDLKALKKSIKDLDTAVAEATEQRKSEHEAYVTDSANNNAALELLGFAKNRLNKFYNPAEYKEPPQQELSAEERAEQAYSFVQIRSHSVDAPPPPPAMPKREKSEGGVIGLIGNIISDLKLEMNQAKLEEEDAQKDYEKLASDAAAKRQANVQSMSEKDAALAQSKGDLLDLQGDHKDAQTDKMEANSLEMALNAECGFLMDNYEARKKAREDEAAGLEKSKAVLAGADAPGALLLQVGSKPSATLLTKSRESSCLASDEEHRRKLTAQFVMLQGFCEDMCKAVGSHPDCAVCNGFVPPPAAGVLDWDGLYAQFDKLKLVGRDMIKEWTGDAGKFGR
jgi:septal ring factor EnvC (AmiA/AmiB activator)